MAQYCLFNFRPDAFFMVYNIFVAKIDQNHKKVSSKFHLICLILMYQALSA